MKRRQYTAEFKKDTAYQIIIEGVAVKELSDRLGVPLGQLYRWKAEHLEEMEANNPAAAPSPKKMAAEIDELRKELAKSKRNERNSKKNSWFFQPGLTMKYEFIEIHQVAFKVSEICDCFEIKPSGYYAWKKRAPSARSIADAEHAKRIEELHEASKKREGHRVIHDHLKDESIACGRDKTLRIMQDLGIAGIQKKSFKPQGTDSNHTLGYSPNRLKAQGMPHACDQVWVCDTTYLMTDNGWNYLATVMDLFSRRIIGWEVSEHNDADLVRKALYRASQTRQGFLNEDLILHSDRGSTYASEKHRKLIKELGIKQSMSAKGNCYDNAAMESFYGRYKTSSVGKFVFADLEALRANAFEYIECYYNTYRKHSSLGYKTPMQIEEKKFPLGGRKLGGASLHYQHTTTNNKNQVALGDFTPIALNCNRTK